MKGSLIQLKKRVILVEKQPKEAAADSVEDSVLGLSSADGIVVASQ